MRNDMQRRLQAYYTQAFPGRQAVQVSNPVSISAGWESYVYAFTAVYGPTEARKREELILRIYPGDDGFSKSAREFRGMSQLYQAGYPVPQVLILEREGSPFGKPFIIMERINGQVLWPILVNASEEKKRALLTLFCKLFVQLHTLAWRPFAEGPIRLDKVSPYDLGNNSYIFVDNWLATYRAYLARFPISGFLPVIAWLEARRDQVPCPRPSLVHWDFHPGNVLLGDDGSAVVIDWTQLEVSDARFDLAWTLLLMSTHTPEGTGENAAWRDLILQEYERLAGAKVEQVTYFEVAACSKRLGSIAISLAYGPEKLGMRPEAVTMMKLRMGAIKRVYDLLRAWTGISVPEVEMLLAEKDQ
jgi:aminoglycoside phosphotransferase (APT) family kinase protein